MKVLVVCTKHKDAENTGFVAPFVWEQTRALQQKGCTIDFFLIEKSGMKGYLRAWSPLRKKIKTSRPDVIHAHYGLSCLLANLASRRVPVVSTYHGSDLNNRSVRPLSRLAMLLSKHNVFVSQKQCALGIGRQWKRSVIPCGIDLSDSQLTPKAEARQTMQLDAETKYVLFAGAFANAVKGPELAKAAVEVLNRKCRQGEDVVLLELRGYSREQVNLLMCATDCLLMTSRTEGSPQVIKEAMACGCPIVSVDVGDVAERISGLTGCCIVSSREPIDIAEALHEVMALNARTEGRKRILEMGLTNEGVAERILGVYHACVLSSLLPQGNDE